MELSIIFKYFVILSSVLSFERPFASSFGSSSSSNKEPTSGTPPVLGNKVQTDSSCMKMAIDASDEIKKALPLLLNKVSALQEIRNSLDLMYQAELPRLSEFTGTDNDQLYDDLSEMRYEINRYDKELEKIDCAIRLHKMLASASQEVMSDQDIIKGLSAVAHKIETYKLSAALRKWTSEDNRMESGMFRMAKEAEGDIKQAHSILVKKQKADQVMLNLFEREMKVAVWYIDEFKEKRLQKKVQTYKADIGTRQLILDCIQILLNMFDCTTKEGDILDEQGISWVIGMVWETLKEANIPTSIIRLWKNKIEYQAEKNEIARLEQEEKNKLAARKRKQNQEKQNGEKLRTQLQKRQDDALDLQVDRQNIHAP